MPWKSTSVSDVFPVIKKKYLTEVPGQAGKLIRDTILNNKQKNRFQVCSGKVSNLSQQFNRTMQLQHLIFFNFSLKRQTDQSVDHSGKMNLKQSIQSVSLQVFISSTPAISLFYLLKTWFCLLFTLPYMSVCIYGEH